MNILITNDDGIYADGLLALKAELDKIGKVWVVAPDRPRSACGHSITLHKPLRADKVELADGSIGYASNGTPSDCVSLAIFGIIKEKVDLVVSGINNGPNLGWDLTYSGTVSAAMEGAICGTKAFSISVATHQKDVNYTLASGIAAKLAVILENNVLPESTLLNVNVPPYPASKVLGIKITRQGKRRYNGQVEKRVDPMGRDYYWLGGNLPIDKMEEGTDVKAVAERYVSVTPVHLDLTDFDALKKMHEWKIDDIDLNSI